MVFLEQTSRGIYYSLYYSSRSHGTVVCTTTCKERNYCVTLPPDDCERTATVALPTAASASFISGDLGTIVPH